MKGKPSRKNSRGNSTAKVGGQFTVENRRMVEIGTRKEHLEANCWRGQDMVRAL